MDQISMNDLENIQWTEECVSLSDFVKTFSLPQIVEVVHGYYASSAENSISSQEVLKLHERTTEELLFCYNDRGEVCKFPIRGQHINIIPPNANTIFHRIEDLSRAKPLPDYVEVCNGYLMQEKHSNVCLKEGEILEVVGINPTRLFSNYFTMTMKKSNGALIKLPQECNAGFKPYIVQENRLLRDVLSSKKVSLPFDFRFVTYCRGTLRAVSIEKNYLVVASCENSNGEIAFMLSEDLDITVKVALGTIRYVQSYESLKTLVQKKECLQNKVRKSKKYQQGSYIANEYQMCSVTLERVSKYNNKDSTLSATTNPLSILVPRPLLPPRKPILHNQSNVDKSNDDDNQQLIAPIIPPKPLSKTTNNSFNENQNIQMKLNSSYIGTSEDINNKEERSSYSNNLYRIITPVEEVKQLDQFKTTISLDHIPELNSNIYQPLQSSDKKSDIYESLQFNRPSTMKYPHQYEKSLAEIKKMNTETFVDVLRILNLQQHVQMFIDNQVNGSLFCELEGNELRDLGLNNFEVRKLMKFKNGWRPT